MTSSSRSITSSSVARETVLGGRAGLVRITLAALLWGTTGVVVQLVRRDGGPGPVDIGFWRLAIAAVVLLLLSARDLRPLLRAARTSPMTFLSTGVCLGAYQALYFLAVAWSGVGVATVVSLGLAPVLLVGWEAVRARRRPGRTTTCTLVAAVTGLGLITASTTEATTSAPHPLLGLLAATGSGLGYATGTVVSRHIAQRTSWLTLTAASTTTGALALAPLALVGGISTPPAAGGWAMLGYLGVVTTAVAYGLFYDGLRTTRGSAAAVVTLLEALAATVLAVVVLGEPLPAQAVAGATVLLGAVAALYVAPQAAHGVPENDAHDPEEAVIATSLPGS